MLLAALAGLLTIRSPGASAQGMVLLDEKPILQDAHNQSVSLTLESPYYQLSGLARTVLGEIAVGLEVREVNRERVRGALSWSLPCFGINIISSRSLNVLSGGELQRTLLAANICTSPRLLLFDEALVELDPSFKLGIVRFVRSYCDSTGSGAIFSTCRPGSAPFVAIPRGIELGPSEAVTHNKTKGAHGSALGRRSQRGIALEIDNLSFAFKGGSPLFSNLSLTLRMGELAFLVGPNGAGKSTLAHIILGVHRPSSGRVLVANQPIEFGVSSPSSGRVAFAFQNVDLMFDTQALGSQLFPKHLTPSQIERGQALVELLGLNPYLDESPFQCPRLVRKRAALVMCAASMPDLLILDEPSIYEDEGGVEILGRAIEFLLQASCACLVISHDEDLLRFFPVAERVRLNEYEHAIVKPAKPNSKAMPSIQVVNHRLLSIDNNQSEREILRRWVARFWSEATADWLGAIPNTLAYWDSYVYPAIEAELHAHSGCTSYVDLGCGHSMHTGRVRRMCERIYGNVVRGLGMDACQDLLTVGNQWHGDEEMLALRRVDISDADVVRSTVHESMPDSADVVTMFYVLHDDPDIDALLASAIAVLKKNGVLLATIVNPARAEHMRSNGVIQQIPSPSAIGNTGKPINGDWDWIGMYPLPAQGGELHVPYFQRTLEAYLKAFQTAGFLAVQVKELGLGGDILQDRAQEFSMSSHADANNLVKVLGSSSSLLFVAKRS